MALHVRRHGASQCRLPSLRYQWRIMLDDITRSVEQPGLLYTHAVGHAGTAVTSQQHHGYNTAQIYLNVVAANKIVYKQFIFHHI